MDKCPFRLLRREEGGVFKICKYAQHNVCCEDLELSPMHLDSWCNMRIEEAMGRVGANKEAVDY
jgi:hypothetical protein